MAGLYINVDISSSQEASREEEARKGNRRHHQFVKRRRFLERRGFIRQNHKLPNRRPDQPRNSLDHSKRNGQASRRLNNNAFHQQGAPDTSCRTVTVGAPCQPSTLSVSINCAPNLPCPAAPHSTPATDAAKKPAKPLIQQHDASEGAPTPAGSVPSYKIVAIDCEMVGTGPKGQNSALARCSIVSYQGDVVYDQYVKPTCPVTDYRTRWSGVRREHLVNAVPFSVAQKEVIKLLHGKTVVGHAIHNDYKALGYAHPKEMTRDTSKIPLLNRKAGFSESEVASLKRLAKQVLHKDIQKGKKGHSSVEDARTTMELYRTVDAEYERDLASGKIPLM